MNIPIDFMVTYITNSKPCQDYLTKNYEHEYSVWLRFSTRNGEQCPLARAALKRIYQLEYQSRGQDFVIALASQNWGHPGYQEGSNGKPDSTV